MSESLTAALEQSALTPKQKEAGDLIAAHRPEIGRLLPSGTDVAALERMVRLAQRDNPKLYDVDPWALVGAAVKIAQTGLTVDALGFAYLVPYGNEVVPIIGYRGYVELAHRSGAVRDVIAELVYDGDLFRVVKGTAPKIVHEPAGPADDREVVAAYAVAHLRTGGTVSVVLYDADWERARKASAAGAKNLGPWKDDRAAMIRKTALRRLEPWLPKTAQFGVALQADEAPAERVDTLIADGGDGGR